ncbi:MAG: addiction module protein [Myxococcaceae bacterium]
MAPERESLLSEVLRLPSKDRAAIAAALLRSLDEEDEQRSVEEAWAEEIRRRLAELDAGTAETVSVAEARRLITADGGET